MASEGADIVITYPMDQEGANKTFEEIKKLGHGA
jgi:hypothetical protein